MVQCPKCRAILQEPPAGNPYYKCGSCFTVLQAKHADNGSGGQKSPNEDSPRLSGQSPTHRKQQLQNLNGPSDDSFFRRQKTMPSLLHEGDTSHLDASTEMKSHSTLEQESEADSSVFRRQRTLPSRLPHARKPEPLPGPKSHGGWSPKGRPGVSGKKIVERGVPENHSGYRSQQVSPSRRYGQDAWQLSGGFRSASFSTDRTGQGLESQQPQSRTPGGSQVSSPRSLSRSDSRSKQYKESPDNSVLFLRQRTLPSKMPTEAKEEELWDDEDDQSQAYMRQTTMPPPRSIDDEEPNPGVQNGGGRYRGSLEKPPSPGRHPNQRQAMLSPKHELFSVKQELSKPELPARLRALLDKKLPSAPKPKASSGSRGGLGLEEERQQSAWSRSKGEAGESRQALKEVLLASRRSSTGSIGRTEGELPGIGQPGLDDSFLGGDHRMSNGAQDGGAALPSVGDGNGQTSDGNRRRESLEDTEDDVVTKQNSRGEYVETTTDRIKKIGKSGNPSHRGTDSSALTSPMSQLGIRSSVSSEPHGWPYLPPPDAPQVVQCQNCSQMLAVPANLPPNKKGVQKLRCGKCLAVSSFTIPSVGDSYEKEGLGYRSDDVGLSVRLGGRERSASPSSGCHTRWGTQALYSPQAISEAGGGEPQKRVLVNGVLLSERALEKAEEKAGPIQTGEFWYDVTAGFWGVMGGPCLGIIPPGIRELHASPMPTDCAGGRTRVYVNGRELHRRDLEKLSRRGLPEIAGKAYSLDVYGLVVDEETGTELRGLGKLAPSLEGRKRGSGMNIPR